MKRSDLTEFEIEEEGLKLRIARSAPQAEPLIVQAAPQQSAPLAYAPPPPAAPQAPAEKPPAAPGSLIKSPMVGTFYSASSPETPPFVKIGDAIEKGSTLCIIEAMKVMNEIQAETKGRIVEILVANGDSVEYGQPLFRLESN